MRTRLYRRLAMAATLIAALVLALPTAALAASPCEGHSGHSKDAARRAHPSTENTPKKKRKCGCCHKSRHRHEKPPVPRPAKSDFCPDCSGHTPLPEAPTPATNKTPELLTLTPQAIVAFLPLPDIRPVSAGTSADPAGPLFGSLPLHAQLCVWLN